ncbi:N-acetylmuramoyl-L-alanine amidase [Stenotrophomonas sp. SRS1]|uniref:N-acetylmuramoyl-L-alanine amidase family protein n=1 Tax=Stenotrophomonas sp. SRS1 TaxID=2870345 RepID=UPI00223890EF|nr:N-acetylmuramoyl-L-alanine amidase [Stenotrophomonas sp. SRS1]MCW6026673.1 N-acetylmuramoyl-L-alanine amidase [Stenotrophomonas sp. SRS1]
MKWTSPWAWGVYALFLFAPAASDGRGLPSSGSLESEAEVAFDALLSRAAQRALDQYRVKAGLQAPNQAVARFDVSTGSVTVDLRGWLPETGGAELEDIQGELMNEVLDQARLIHPASGVEFRYNGKRLEEHYPEEGAGAPLSLRRLSLPGPVVVSAGHGWYFHHRFRDWRAQRDPSDGIIEDEITPGYADELRHWLMTRSSVDVRTARSRAADSHEGSLQAWWRMAARYRFQASFPGQPQIWNSLPGSTHALRERDEDIRSRPLYANDINAAALLHLHTNAAGPSATGARVFFERGRGEDERLGRSILCYMKELITAQDGYASYVVPAAPEAGSHGENRLAQMPSVIVEAGFHTNPSDAIALQDPVFRTAAMKGVEKGYRLHREGKDCAPLKAGPIRGLQLPQGMSEEVDVPFEGYPQYPIELVTTNIACPPTWTCRDGLVRIQAPGDQPHRITIRCENVGTAPVVWHTSVVDADGVKSPPVRHSVVCIRNAGRAVSGESIPEGAAVAG